MDMTIDTELHTVSTVWVLEAFGQIYPGYFLGTEKDAMEVMVAIKLQAETNPNLDLTGQAAIEDLVIREIPIVVTQETFDSYQDFVGEVEEAGIELQIHNYTDE